MSSSKSGNSPLARVAGLGLAAVGIAHFTNPGLLDQLTRQAFPENTRTHTYIDGGVETVLGLGLILPRTRRFAAIGALAYAAYVGANAVRHNS